MTGRIHSIETFGTVDGPGVRFVVFFQGCPMRCRYCHNPDTWDASGGTRMEAGQILGQMEKNRVFYRSGGLTATGGEPMLQMDFLTALFEGAKAREFHTCLDTSGILFPTQEEQKPQVSLTQLDRLLDATDLVLLDLKHIDSKAHRDLTGYSNRASLSMARYLDEKKKPVWIRHVVVPGITYDEGELFALGKFIGTLSNVERIEALPYHAMGRVKYEALGLPYSLEDTRQLTKDEAKKAYEIICAGREGV